MADPAEPAAVQSADAPELNHLGLTAFASLVGGCLLGVLFGSPEQFADNDFWTIATTVALVLTIFVALDAWEPHLEGWGVAAIRRHRPRLKLVVPMGRSGPLSPSRCKELPMHQAQCVATTASSPSSQYW